MKGIGLLFFASGAAYGMGGMVLGLWMGGHQDFTLAPVHAHLNLVGFVTMCLMGVFYHLTPSAADRALSRAEVEASPLYELIDVPLGGATQTIGAGAASVEDAALLDVPAGSPVLVCERITRSVDGRPVLMSEHVFPAHLTVFSVELSSVDPSIAPSGLRLVE